MHTSRWYRRLATGLAFLAGTAVWSQAPVPLAPGQTLFQLDLSTTPVGEFPASVRQLSGQMSVVSLDGKLMLKATASSEFLITLPQLLPAAFTIEFDIVPKAGGNPQDLSFEGTSRIDQGTGSAHILWHATGELIVIGGGGEGYDSPMPDELKATLPGALTHVVADFQGNTVKLYTNGRRHYTLNKSFTRGRYLRVFLGGQDDATLAVHLAALRISSGSSLGIIAAEAGIPASRQPAATPPADTGNKSPVKFPGPGGVSTVDPQAPVSTTSGLNTTRDGIAITVTMGATAPVVTWARYPGASGYTVSRSKSDDANCCNATSGRPWGATSPWQDSPLPQPGVYTYTVTGNMGPGAQVRGQALFDFNAPTVTPPISGNAGIPANSFAVTVTMTRSGPSVSWPRVPNATRYNAGRWKTDERGCCDTSSPRAGGASSPWQDQPLPKSGMYTYLVEAITPAGPVTAETHFAFTMPSAVLDPTTPPATAQPIATPAPTPMGPAGPGRRTPTPNDPPTTPASDPSSFTATPDGPGKARFEWAHVTGVDRYLINGPGTTNGIMVAGADPGSNAKNSYTLSGVPAGEHTWTIASNYEPGGVRTAGGAWPKATATITGDLGSRYRIVALGFKAIKQSKEINDAKDGHGDEVYFAAIANRTKLTGIPLPATKTPPNISIVVSRSYGDEAVSVPYGRIKAGTASPTGGMQSGDLVPSTLDLTGATGALQRHQFPLLIWEGVLDDSTAVVVHPTLWEDDVDPAVQAWWAQRVIEEAQNGYSVGFPQYQYAAGPNRTGPLLFNLSRGEGQSPDAPIYAEYLTPAPHVASGQWLIECMRGIASGIVITPCSEHGVDRPIGLSGFDETGTWYDHIVLLTKAGVETVLNRVHPFGSTPRTQGTFVVSLDESRPANEDIWLPKYELYLRVERVP